VIVLADTHALIWWLTDPSRLSRIAHKQLRAAHDDAADGISISVASRIDLHYLGPVMKLLAFLAFVLAGRRITTV
jgi:PIN domain nuclease of toxin-antitoxin system